MKTPRSQNPGGVLVCASRGRLKLAIGVPRSDISLEALWAWNKDLAVNGIRCLWLLTQGVCPVTQDLPAVSLHRISGQYIVRIPSGTGSDSPGSQSQSGWQQSLTLDEFLRSALNGQFWFGVIRLGAQSLIRLDGGESKCPTCGCWIKLCCALEVFSTYPESSFVFYSLEDIPEAIISVLMRQNTSAIKLGQLVRIKHQGQTATFNSCFNCHEVIPHIYAIELVGRESSIAQFTIEVDKALASTMATLPQARWRVSLDLQSH